MLDAAQSDEEFEQLENGLLVAKVFSPNGVDIGRRLVSAGAPSRVGAGH